MVTRSKCNVLITFAGRKSYVYQALAKSNRAGRIVAADMDPQAAVGEYARYFEIVPPVRNAENYVTSLMKICRKHSIHCIIPLNDMDLLALARHSLRFHSIGVRVLGASMSINQLVRDKLKVGKWLSKLGFNYPDTVLPSRSLSEQREYRFPLAVKSRFGQGSEHFRRLRNREELRTIPGNSILQKWISGAEYNLDILRDSAGHVVSVVPKLKLEMKYGSTDKAKSTDDPELIELGVKLGQAMGHIGTIDVDVIRDRRKTYVLDINPRLGGGFPFTAIFCPEYVDALLAIGLSESPASLLGRYRKDVVLYRDFHYFESMREIIRP